MMMMLPVIISYRVEHGVAILIGWLALVSGSTSMTTPGLTESRLGLSPLATIRNIGPMD